MRQSMSSRLGALPVGFQSDRTELLNLLLNQGILYRSPQQPVLSRDGTSARWMLDSLAVTLTSRGVELAGRCLLELLSNFDGHQLATYGVTGLPLLASCILQSRGKYRGLVVRKDKKRHGSLKIIEGPIDRAEPVILVDDSISSGISMTEACERLQSAGFRVEGCVVLVRFGWYGGYARMQELGFHMETVFDVWADLMANMEDELLPLKNPSKYFPDFDWCAQPAPEGLHPATLARVVLEEYFSSGRVLRSPERLDHLYDASGGVWVSIRSRDNIYVRHGRDGFWNFPGEKAWSPPESVIRAAIRTAQHLDKLENKRWVVQNSHFAVTFFSALQPCAISDLDNERYGIVVRSEERPSQMGGALPRMPGIGNEWEQFEHARTNNGRLVSFEPFTIYRHDLTRLVEPDAPWQPTGVPRLPGTPWHEDTKLCGSVADRARDLVIVELLGTNESTLPLADDLLPRDVDSIFLTVYVEGRLRGCRGSAVRNLDLTLRTLAAAGARDDRFPATAVTAKESITVSVSFLFNALELGFFSTEEVTHRALSGRHALMAYRDSSFGLLLPSVAVTYNLSAPVFCSEVLAKAGIKGDSAWWCRFDCGCWLADNDGVWRMEGAFKSVSSPAWSGQRIRDTAKQGVRYLLKQQRNDGSFVQNYYPFQHRYAGSTSIQRRAHAAWTLARVYKVLRVEDAAFGAKLTIESLLEKLNLTENECWLEADEPASVSELSFLLLALCEFDDRRDFHKQASAISSTLWGRIDIHGRVATHRSPALSSAEPYQDYYPGQLLLALAKAVTCELTSADSEKLQRAFKFYRHRFRYKPSFGQVSWLMQAFTECWRITRDQELCQFVFEVGLWILKYQHQKTGAFMNDHQSDTPGYTTALYSEGVASALALASESGDSENWHVYWDSSRRALAFLDRLIIQKRDSSVLPNADAALGGVRASLYRSEIRVDFVQHLLSALLDLYPLFDDEQPSENRYPAPLIARPRSSFLTPVHGHSLGGT
jgi:orotate phosphoribosyltransferase/AMMECR1 domain-containing protein